VSGSVAGPLTREQAAAAVESAVRERDTIQANLLDLDGSFGKRLLAGATLTGGTRTRWDAATAELATLWETFTAYSAVVDRATQLQSGPRRVGGLRLLELTTLLTGPSVRLSRPSAAVARGDLTGGGEAQVTIAAAVREMRRSFAAATAVTTAAEAVWNEVAGPLQEAGAALAGARQQTAGLGDDELRNTISAAEADLAQLRETLNHDPLALHAGGRPDLARVGRLTQRVTAATQRASQLAALRADSAQRIAAVTVVVTAARQAWQDAMAARKRAFARIAAGELPAPPDVSGLAVQLAGLDVLAAEGRWIRLDAELDGLSRQATAIAAGCRDAEQQAVALVERRDELRGLLDAYRARAAKLGGAEDPDLDERYDRAHGLLWTAPCDLPAAADAVTGYQQAVLALSGRGQQQ
jgi:hypothetical protein